MRVQLTCLSTGFKDNDGEYVLECEDAKYSSVPQPICRYLFNARDGTQRLCNEYSLRLSKLKAIFITRMSPETLGGLPGSFSRSVFIFQECFSPSTTWVSGNWRSMGRRDWLCIWTHFVSLLSGTHEPSSPHQTRFLYHGCGTQRVRRPHSTRVRSRRSALRGISFASLSSPSDLM